MLLLFMRYFLVDVKQRNSVRAKSVLRFPSEGYNQIYIKKEEVKNVILQDRDRHHKHGNKTLLNVNYNHVNGATFGLYMEN